MFFVCLLTYDRTLLIVGSVTLTAPPERMDHIGSVPERLYLQQAEEGNLETASRCASLRVRWQAKREAAALSQPQPPPGWV